MSRFPQPPVSHKTLVTLTAVFLRNATVAAGRGLLHLIAACLGTDLSLAEPSERSEMRALPLREKDGWNVKLTTENASHVPYRVDALAPSRVTILNMTFNFSHDVC